MLAFGSLVAAGLPLMLTILGLVASAGSLYLGTQLSTISIWAMNFALMFALALGIDYALFVVHRFRGALFGSRLDAERRRRGDDGHRRQGRALLGRTVLISLSAVMLVPSPAFRSMALGIMISVFFVLLATLTLLPAVLAKLGPRIDRLALRWAHSGEHRSPRFAGWAERLWRRPLALGLGALDPRRSCDPDLRPEDRRCPRSRSSRLATPLGRATTLVQHAFGPGAPGRCRSSSRRGRRRVAATVLSTDPGIARVMPRPGLRRARARRGRSRQDPSNAAVGRTIDRLRAALPAGALVGGAAAENHDLEQALVPHTRS